MKSGIGLVGMLMVGALAVAGASTRSAEAASPTLRATVAAPRAGQTSATITAAVTTTTSTALPSDVDLPVSDAAVTGAEIVTPPNPIPFLENPKLRRLQKKETSLAMRQAAAAIVRKYYAKPVGTQVEVDVEGTHLVARIERHFHPEGGPVKPWGFHPGVSLFVYR